MNRSKSSVSEFGRLTHLGRFNLAIIVATSLYAIMGNTPVDAGLIISTPPGLHTNDKFRIIFATEDFTTATSTFITTYNTFVNHDATTEAGGGAVTYRGIPLLFSAIGSTASVNAITNIGQTNSPVFLANGTEIANSDTAAVGGLWAGTLQNPIGTDLINLVPSGTDSVWTGTRVEGLAAANPLGGANSASGRLTVSGADWVQEEPFPSGVQFHVYGISQALTVPEPSSIVLCLSAAGCGAVGAYVRRRRYASANC